MAGHRASEIQSLSNQKAEPEVGSQKIKFNREGAKYAKGEFLLIL
jgi:hypothetical protein